MSGRAWLAALAFLAAGCSGKKGPVPPVAGLLGASGPVYRVVGKEQSLLQVGAVLRPADVLRAEGTAVLEYFNDAVHVVQSGTVEVGDLPERKLASSNLPHRVLKEGTVREAPLRAHVVAVRYVDPQLTPEGNLERSKDTVNNHFRDFFAAGGHTLGEPEQRPEGPPGGLPPPPFREKLPHVHAGERVVDGPLLVVEQGVVVAEDAALSTWTFTAGQRGGIGGARRLRFSSGTRGVLQLPSGAEFPLEGPLDLDLRR